MILTTQQARKLVTDWVGQGRPPSAGVVLANGKELVVGSEVAWALLVGLATAGPMPRDQEVSRD